MNKIKKISLLVGVALVLFAPVVGLIPPFIQKASAAGASGSWWDKASVEDRVGAEWYIMAMASCISHDSYSGENKGAEDISNYNFFSNDDIGNDSTPIGVYMSQQLNGGNDDDDGKDGGDGKLSCEGDESERFVSGFAELLSKSDVLTQAVGAEDPVSYACFLGWYREDFGESTADCVGGSGDLHTPDSADAFVKRVTKALAGKETTDIHSALQGDAERYYFWMQSFNAGCYTTSGKVLGVYGENATNDNLVDSAGGDDNYYKIDLLDDDGKVQTYVVNGGQDRHNNRIAGTKSNYDKWNPDCSDIAKYASQYAEGAGNAVAADPDKYGAVANFGAGVGSSPGGDPTNSGSEIEVKCADEWDLLDMINPLDWLTCSILKGFTEAAKAFDGLIMGMLCVNEGDIFGTDSTCESGVGGNKTNTDEAFHKAWNVFRILALGLLAIGGLIMVISQGLGFEIFDAYTVKRTMPRLIVAAIGISLSWQLLAFLVTLSNGLGIGVRSLIYAPFNAAGLDQVILGGGTSALTALFAGGAFVALGALGLLSFIGTALLAILVAFFTLVIRNIIVIMLILVAPVAIAAYILPNTEKYFKTWWDWLLKALLVFPLITGFIAVGHVFAAITSTQGGTLTNFVAFAAYFAPYFMIPLAFRFLGGLMATLGGFANDRSRGAFDRLKNFRKAKTAKNMEAARNFSRFSERSRIGKGLNTALGAGLNPTSVLGGVAGVNARRASYQALQGANSMKDNKIFQANQNDDNFLLAVANRKLAEKKLQDARDSLATATTTEDQDKYRAEVRAREQGLNNAGQMNWFDRENRSTRTAALDALTKTGYQFGQGAEGYEELDSTVKDIVGGDKQARSQMMNTAQYNLKSAGRYDLGGINNGAGYSASTGIGKASLYELANGKGESIKEMVSSLPAGQVGEQHAIAYKELQAMLPNAKGGNAKTINDQLEALRARGVEEYMATPVMEQRMVKVSPDALQRGVDQGNPWSAAERNQGYRYEPRSTTQGAIADKKARTYERPDPNHMG